MRWTKCHGEEGLDAQESWDRLFRRHPQIRAVLSGDQSYSQALHEVREGDAGNRVLLTIRDPQGSGSSEVIEVVVQLEEWSDNGSYDRTGLARDETEILGVSIPRVTVPLNPGKNITVIAEVVAMNHLLRYAGIDSAADFDRKLRGRLLPARDYLEEDYE